MSAYKGKYHDNIIFYCVKNPHIACNVYASVAQVFAFQWMVSEYRVVRILRKDVNSLFKLLLYLDIKS